MQAGNLVRYVDGSNVVKLGLLVNDTAETANADIIPLDTILSLGALVLGPITVGGLKSCKSVGGPPYWIPDPALGGAV